MKYKYTGTIAVAVPGIGVVNPMDVVESKVPMNHPLFKRQQQLETIDQKPATEKQSKSKKASKSR